MSLNKHSLGILVLVVVIIAGGLTVWVRYPKSTPIVITSPQASELTGSIFINGAVACPGFYPLKADDTLDDLIQAAGGSVGGDLNRIELYIPQVSNRTLPQKIDINRAESWLLQALPDIGKTRADAIIQYRNHNGPFRYTYEITNVEGVSAETHSKIKELISVSE